MTRTEDRLTDALGAAAHAVREDTLRPLLVPQPPRRSPAWAAPVAAAAAMLMVVGVGALAGGWYLPGSGRASSAAAAPPRYYVAVSNGGGPPVVHSTATGLVTDTVKIPEHLGRSILAASSNGVQFVAVTDATGATGEHIYRFLLSAAGQVRGLSLVPGGTLGDGRSWGAVGAMAASPDGSQLAVALTSGSWGYLGCGTDGVCNTANPGAARCGSRPCVSASSYIDVINTATGARKVWKGGTGQGFAFRVVGLSWTGDGSELAYFGQWCPQTKTATACPLRSGTGGAKAEVRTLNLASRGGSLTSGRLLFRVPVRFPYVEQAVISPDGSTITAVVLTGAQGARGKPTELAVEQISVATGKLLSVNYRQNLIGRGRAFRNSWVTFTPAYMDPFTFNADGSGLHWIISGQYCDDTSSDMYDGCGVTGFNGWIDGGRLMPLLPAVNVNNAENVVNSEAW
jgi:hypothetical protein